MLKTIYVGEDYNSPNAELVPISDLEDWILSVKKNGATGVQFFADSDYGITIYAYRDESKAERNQREAKENSDLLAMKKSTFTWMGKNRY